MRRLILKTFQCPGDVLMLTAAVRDLHLAHPGKFQTDVRTSVPAIWQNNTRLTPLEEGQPGVEVIDMHYPLVHQSNQRPYHFLHGYPQYLEQKLGVAVPLTRFAGEVFLSPEEKQGPSQVERIGHQGQFWIIVAGGKTDFTAKWFDPERYQAVVDHFQGRIQFVQCGEDGHWHPRLKGVIDLVGNTGPRELIALMHHAQGVVCGVTYAMHLAAAVEVKKGQPARRACVVVAGGREPTHWEAYPQHQYISTSGMLSCCADGGCWKSRCQLVGDGDVKDRDELCTQPVQITPELRIPRCMDLITPDDVIRRIDMYLEGGNLELPRKQTKVLIDFGHGLGDAVQLSIVLAHLKKLRPDWLVDVAALVGKHSAFNGLCRQVLIKDREVVDRSRYDRVFELPWPECPVSFNDSPSTKAEFCLRDVFQITPVEELCRYSINISQRAKDAARTYLTSVCRQTGERYPVVLIHYQGNTSIEKKDISHDLVGRVCQDVLASGFVPVILDWDGRTPLADGLRIHNPGPNNPLWGGIGTGDAETIAALVEASTLMIGIDSGPLHVACATSTPTIAVWTGHHPLHYVSLSDHVTHLVPQNHRVNLRSPAEVGLAYFQKHYKNVSYIDLEPALRQMVQERLMETTREQPPELRSKAYNEDYYREHRAAGLDYLNYGDWQRDYGRWLVDTFDLKGQAVLDVGCACGSILNGFAKAGAKGCGVDLCEPMVQLGRKKFPDLRLDICDSANLHLFSDHDFDFIHSAQSAEHFKPDLVPHILRELHRVAKPGASFFCALDTQELYDRQGREGLKEDPTHICIQPMAWWHEQLAEAGWEVCTEKAADDLKNHRLSFLRTYDWDWFVARKPAPIIVSRLEPIDPLVAQFQQSLADVIHPDDEPFPESWLAAYVTLFDLARQWNPLRICEIGVRAGYSAFALLSACPQASLLGIDADQEAHGGRPGMCKHAERILAPFDFQLLLIDSHAMKRLPPCDLVHVDGDHTKVGCLADLRLAAQAAPRIVVDDYQGIPSVQAACDEFSAQFPEFQARRIENGHNGLIVFERSSRSVERNGSPLLVGERHGEK